MNMIYLQLAFWQNRSISLVDMYVNQGEPSEKCGELNFGLEYDFATQTLKLKIIQVSLWLTVIQSLFWLGFNPIL